MAPELIVAAEARRYGWSRQQTRLHLLLRCPPSPQLRSTESSTRSTSKARTELLPRRCDQCANRGARARS